MLIVYNNSIKTTQSEISNHVRRYSKATKTRTKAKTKKMISWFDMGSLIIAGIGWYFSSQKPIASMIFITFVLYNLIYLLNIHITIGAAYFIVSVIISTFFFFLSHKVNADSIVNKVFLVSLGYNSITFWEFFTQNTYLYDCYSVVMQTLTVVLLLNIYINGRIGTHISGWFSFINRDNNNHQRVWLSRFYNRGSQ